MINLKPHMRDGETPRCQQKVTRYHGNWPTSGQCCRSAKVGDRCKQHDPAHVEAKRRVQDEKWREERKRQNTRHHAPKLLKVLKAIAAGHNDPRQLAQDTIDELEKDNA